jgi:hypothetical protein
MTVKELIEKLSKVDETKNVKILDVDTLLKAQEITCVTDLAEAVLISYRNK